MNYELKNLSSHFKALKSKQNGKIPYFRYAEIRNICTSPDPTVLNLGDTLLYVMLYRHQEFAGGVYLLNIS